MSQSSVYIVFCYAAKMWLIGQICQQTRCQLYIISDLQELSEYISWHFLFPEWEVIFATCYMYMYYYMSSIQEACGTLGNVLYCVTMSWVCLFFLTHLCKLLYIYIYIYIILVILFYIHKVYIEDFFIRLE